MSRNEALRAETEAPTIPVIDLGALTAAERPSAAWRAAVEAVADGVTAACHDTGFFYIANHGVPDALTEGVLEADRVFHALPLDDKLALKLNAWMRGYQPMASSRLLKTARFPPAAGPNQLESYIVREEVPPDHPDYKARPFRGPNQWPDEALFGPDFTSGFRKPVERYFDATRALAMKMLPVFSVAVGEAPDFFDPYFDPPGATLRMIHYPPTPERRPDDHMGNFPHTDYGFITILAQDDTGGLEIQRVDGSWVEAPHIPGCFVVNIADAMARWTNDVFNSSPHRVINKSTTRDRYSVACFFDPNHGAEIRCLDTFVADGAGPNHPSISFGAYYQDKMDINHPDRRPAD